MFGRYWRKCPPGPSCAHAPRLPRPNAPPMRARKEPTCKPLGKPGREDGPHERPTVIRVSGWSAAVRVVCCACVCVLGGRGPARVQAARARVRVRECEGVGESRGGHPRFLGAPHWCEKREASHQKIIDLDDLPCPRNPCPPPYLAVAARWRDTTLSLRHRNRPVLVVFGLWITHTRSLKTKKKRPPKKNTAARSDARASFNVLPPSLWPSSHRCSHASSSSVHRRHTRVQVGRPRTAASGQTTGPAGWPQTQR